jgi:hypothetical protein
MADITQGGLLQPTITTAQSQTTVPDFYSNYLQDIANLGRNAVQQGGVAGLSPLQQQAINMAPQMAFAGSSSMGTGQNLLTQAGQTGAPELAQAYMNPYQDYMTDELGRLTQRNVQENVLPSLDAAAIGTGNYGSSRAQNMKGQTLRDISTDLFGKQMAQLGTGYQQAITNAQNDLTRAASTGSSLGNLGAQQSALGTGALTTLGNIGKTQQTQAQTELDYPMAQAAKFATLLPSGAVPTGQITNTINPGQQGQFANSPLANVQSLAAYLAAMTDPKATGESIAKATVPTAATTPTVNLAGKKDGGEVHMADGGYMDDDQGSVDFGPDQYANDHLTDVGGMDHTPSGYEDDYSLPEGYTLDEEGNLVSPDGEIIEIA